jgi:hypothetical protein
MLSLKNNRLATKEAGRALATALAVNSVLKELDLSCNAWDDDSSSDDDDSDEEDADGPGFAQELAHGIKDNGSLSVLDLCCNGIGHCNDLPPGWSLHLENREEYRYKHTNGQHQEQAPSGAKSTGVAALANAICNNGAMTSLNLTLNSLGIEGAKIIADILPKCT